MQTSYSQREAATMTRARAPHGVGVRPLLRSGPLAELPLRSPRVVR